MSIDLEKKREISSIGFPYLDLDDAIAVARTMHSAGGVAMERDQLAAALGQVPTSGAFNMKLSTTRIFGLLESVQGRYQLTDLGFSILDPDRERAAKAEAFLNVPLYRRAYEEWKGRQLPPRPIGLERAFEGFGVSPKQTDRARQVFDRSARSAGFFPTPAEDRLVAPLIAASRQDDSRQAEEQRAAAVPPPAPPPELDGVITALIDKLPRSGNPFPPAARTKWLTMMEMAFDLAYPAADDDPLKDIIG